MKENLSIVLVETTHAGNIGAAARAMKTMGYDDLRLVRPCKYLTAESLARASGADDIVKNAPVFDSLEDALRDRSRVFGTSARSRTLEWSSQELPEAVAEIHATDMAAAVVFGRERSGLTNDELALCHSRLAIPSNPDFSSLNLASAVQVVTYELRRGRGFETAGANVAQSDTPGEPVASHETLEHMFDHIERVAVNTGFLDPENPRLLMQRFRRLFSRASLLSSEAQIMRGFLTAVEKSLHRSI